MPLIPWENSKVGPGIKYCPCASWFVVIFLGGVGYTQEMGLLFEELL